MVLATQGFHPEVAEGQGGPLLLQRLPLLRREGVELVPVSTLTEADPRRKPWRVYSSPLPPVVKSLKP